MWSNTNALMCTCNGWYFIEGSCSAFVLTNPIERYASENNNNNMGINNNIVRHNNVNQATSGTVWLSLPKRHEHRWAASTRKAALGIGQGGAGQGRAILRKVLFFSLSRLASRDRWEAVGEAGEAGKAGELSWAAEHTLDKCKCSCTVSWAAS